MEPHVYDQFSELENKHWWFCARRDYLTQIIRSLGLKQDKQYEFCEVGSGTGGNLAMLAEFAILDAVEMNDAARARIKEKVVPGLRNVFSGHLPDNMSLEKQYDAVFSLDVIEHVEDDLAALVKLKEFVREDGYLVTTVPAYQWLWSAHDVANHHKRRYTKRQYCNLMAAAGYEITYASYFNTFLFPLAALSRTLNGLRSKSSASHDADLVMPNALVNKVFKKIFSFESNWAGKFSMPFGLSIVVIAKKNESR